jgi:hypothetical protein
MRVHILADRTPGGGELQSTRLSLSLTLVLRPPGDAADAAAGRPAPPPRAYSSWRLGALLGVPGLRGACPVADASRLLVQLPPQLAEGEHAAALLAPPPARAKTAAGAGGGRRRGQQQEGGAAGEEEGDVAEGEEAPAQEANDGEWVTPAFTLSPRPDEVVFGSGSSSSGGSNGDSGGSSSIGASPAFYVYDLRAMEARERRRRRQQFQASSGSAGPVTLDAGQVWPLLSTVRAAPADAPALTTARYTTGAGFMHGGITLRLAGTGAARAAPATASPRSGGRNFTVCVFQAVPWYVRVWLHTLKLTLDGTPVDLDAHLALRHVAPASDRAAPLTLDLCLELPAGASEAALSVQFSKAFLHVFEWPPDAHRGFDVPAAVVTYAAGSGLGGSGSDEAGPLAWAWRGGSEGGSSSGKGRGTGASVCSEGENGAAAASPLLRAVSEARGVARLYADALLVPLAPPDFSMPYNVVCLTSTVLAVYIGATLNALLRRPGEELRLAAKGGGGRAAARKRAAKVVAVVLLFGGLALYVDEELREQLAKGLAAAGLIEAPEGPGAAPGH